jgi:glycine amidinotransferase/scyllo-inosamine-4-phosphate amidinotransferase 1
MLNICSYNEWDPLEEVVVGTIKKAQFPHKDKGQLAIEFPDCKNPEELPAGSFDQKIIEETDEDLTVLVETFTKLGIKVRRPEITDHSKWFSTPNWKSNGFYNYCPRDVMLVIGNNIIETPMALRCRFFETDAYKTILVDSIDGHSKWIAAPKPGLHDNTYNTSNNCDLALNNHEPIFDAANILRAGKDLFYLISSTGNELGCKWLQNYLSSEFRVHPCRNLYNSVHIDSTLALLRPGLVLLNPERVNKKNLPKALEKWEKIWCPPLIDIGYSGKHAYSSIWVGMNLLMINPQLAIVDKEQIELIRLLERYKIHVIPLQLRHARTLGGGFHCVTLDLRRNGKLENYFA